MYLTIEVTQDHIDAGTKQSSGNCPVALALLDVSYNPHVYSNGSMELRSSLTGTHLFPKSKLVRQFIYQFDSGQPVNPFKFRIQDR